MEENNKLIADFLDVDIGHANMIISPTNGWWSIPKYHESWDWLMPVVVKVKDIIAAQDEDTQFHTWPPILNALVCVNKELIHQEMVNFIKWYNENK